MSETIPFATDLGTLVAFDPETLKHRVRDAGDWWRVDPVTDLAEVADGRAALLRVGAEGEFRVRLRLGDALDPDEAARVVGVIEGLRLQVRSGELFVGAAERLPGNGVGERYPRIPGTGELVPVPAGAYALEAHVLRWRDDDAFYDEDGEVLADAPPDFVLLLRAAPPADLGALPDDLPDLLDLMPKAEAKGQAKVRGGMRRRGPVVLDASPGRRRRRASEPREGPSVPRAPRHVPEERAPYSDEQVRAALREVLWGHALHPSARLGVEMILLAPRDPKLQRHDVGGDDLLKKVTRVREQLRTLEQKVNGSERLDLEEKLDLDAEVTRLYQRMDALLEFLADAAT